MSQAVTVMQRRIMLLCFIGTHIPLTALCVYAVLNGLAGLEMVLVTALVSTLVGAGVALLAIRNGFRQLSQST